MGQGVYGESLCLPLNFARNLLLLLRKTILDEKQLLVEPCNILLKICQKLRI